MNTIFFHCRADRVRVSFLTDWLGWWVSDVPGTSIRDEQNHKLSVVCAALALHRAPLPGEKKTP